MERNVDLRRKERADREAQSARYDRLGERLSQMAGVPLVRRQRGDAYSLHGLKRSDTWERGASIPPTWDHGTLWWERGRRNSFEARYLTSEPYQRVDDEDFVASERAWAQRNGLRLIEVSADSPWNPGGTILLVFERGPVRLTRVQLDRVGIEGISDRG